MDYLNLFLAVVGTIMGAASFTETFRRWRPYLMPASTALIGIMIGYFISSISKSNIIFTADDVLKYLGYFFIGTLLSGLIYLTFLNRDHAVALFFGAMFFLILVLGAVNIMGSEHYLSTDEMIVLADRSASVGNYDRAVQFLEELALRYRKDESGKSAIDKRIADLKRQQLGASSAIGGS